jgi:hypothetical protein
MEIDVDFDFRTDASGKDPDMFSSTLRRYHCYLWSKQLPNGALFVLSDTSPGTYLYHISELGEFFLSSDSVIQTFTRWKRLKLITDLMTVSENEEFLRISYTIGGMMIFPGNRVNGRQTINGARGLSQKICDRMDLTLECIRRHYVGLESPLSATISRYDDFFALFGDFHGYVNFFLLDDLVDENADVKYFMSFDDFNSPSVPFDVETYKQYRRRSIEFVQARNLRMMKLDNSILSDNQREGTT